MARIHDCQIPFQYSMVSFDVGVLRHRNPEISMLKAASKGIVLKTRWNDGYSVTSTDSVSICVYGTCHTGECEKCSQIVGANITRVILQTTDSWICAESDFVPSNYELWCVYFHIVSKLITFIFQVGFYPQVPLYTSHQHPTSTPHMIFYNEKYNGALVWRMTWFFDQGGPARNPPHPSIVLN